MPAAKRPPNDGNEKNRERWEERKKDRTKADR
jgi:hypothetical protein